MPATMAQLLGDRARITINGAGGFSIFVDYRPQLITTRSMREELHRAAKNEPLIDTSALENVDETDTDKVLAAADAALDQAEAAVIQKCVDRIIAWDLLDDDGRVVPITFEALCNVDVRLLKRINQEIEADNRLGETNGANSSMPSVLPSSRAERRATSRRKSRNGSH